MNGAGQDEGYLPTSLLSSDGAQGPFPRSTPLILSRRARQIQADEGILPAQTGRSHLPGNQDLGDPTTFDDARASRGRARAGTLPSSWGNLSAPSLPNTPSLKASDNEYLDHLSSQSNLSLRNKQLPAGLGSQLLLNRSAYNDAPPTFHPAVPANNRIRSGSLTLPDDGFANAFGPSIFTTWQPSRSGLSSLSMTGNTAIGPAHEDASGGSNEDEYGSRDTFDESSTLDYLGLADPRPRHQETAGANPRHRASTMASMAARPRMSASDGRARSSSFLPGFNFEHVSERDESVDHHDVDHQAHLASAAMHNRMKQLGDDLGSGQGLSPGPGARPRATSMGRLDAPVAVPASLSPPNSATLAFEIDEEAIRNYAMEQNIDPNAFVTFAQNKALRASFSNGHASPMGLAGRHRAGTIAALSGPEGRQRTEQELTRMSLAPNASQRRNVRMSALSSYLDASVASELTGGHGPRQNSSTLATMSPGTPSGQSGHPPSRSLYIGQLSPSTTGQELMQAFAPYGAIDTLRLLPEKECGFINFVEMQDAVHAKDDIMGRLGGKIGLRSTSQDGAIRIGFGKIDAVPQGPQSINASGATTRAVPSPRLDQAGADGSFGSPGEGLNDQPTRALWIGSIPATTSLSALLSIFTPFGPVESVRVLPNKNCGFINFERVDDAVRARKALHGRDVLGAKVGGVRIGFAKVPSKNQDSHGFSGDSPTADFPTAIEALADLKGATSVPVDQQLSSGNLEDYRSNLILDLLEKQRSLQSGLQAQPTIHKSTSSPAVGRGGSFPTHSCSNSIVPSSDKGGVPLPAEMRPQATTSDWQLIIRQLDENDPEAAKDAEAVANTKSLATYYTKIPLVSEGTSNRKFDTTKLRELRKNIEASNCTQAEIDQIAGDFLPDIVDLSSDFIGNTLVQKFFDKCSDSMKVSMLESIAPHLAKIGIHKNGTWAAQKIIDCATTDEQRSIIAEHLRPYVPPLLTDQYGNYVVQKVIPFGSPHSDFIFDAMIHRCWEVAQGRFGARSMRAVLESSQASKFQQKRVAAAIILNSVPLATSQNGALLVTWLLDSQQFPGRFRLLVPRFTPHLAQLCTHKLASLTLLRIITQSVDPEASRQVLQALLDPSRPHILEEVVKDQVHGSQFISRLLASTALDHQTRAIFVERVSDLLIQHRLLGAPPYRALVENLGLTAARPAASVNSFVPPAVLAPASSMAYGTMPILARSVSFPYMEQPALGPAFAADGMMELNHAMAQASLSGPMQQPQHPVVRGPKPGSRASKSPRSPFHVGAAIGGEEGFAERNGGADERPLQDFQPNGVLRSPTSDAFNPWGPTNATASPERRAAVESSPMLAHGGGDPQSLLFGGGHGHGVCDVRGYSFYEVPPSTKATLNQHFVEHRNGGGFVGAAHHGLFADAPPSAVGLSIHPSNNGRHY